jgi:uncharacterized membrane protein YcaP (DUF421 family)
MDSVFRGLAVYLVLLLVTRSAGRRTMAQVTVFDFVLLLIIAETTDQALLGDDFSVTNAAVVIVTLVLTDVALSYLKSWSPRTGALLDGVPTVLISNGQPDRKAMARARVGLDEILESAREKHGLKRLDQIDCAVLEVGGSISIIPRDEKTPP